MILRKQAGSTPPAPTSMNRVNARRTPAAGWTPPNAPDSAPVGRDPRALRWPVRIEAGLPIVDQRDGQVAKFSGVQIGRQSLPARAASESNGKGRSPGAGHAFSLRPPWPDSMARSTAPACPAITIWSGELRFAALTTSPCAASFRMESSLPSGSLSKRRHRAHSLRNGLLHIAPALADQTHCVGELETSCRHQCRVFAQTVPGDDSPASNLALQAREGRDRHRQQRRLRVLG